MGEKILVTLGFITVMVIISVVVRRIKMTAKEVEHGATSSYKLSHQYGLPYAEKEAPAYLYISSEKLIVECEGRTYMINFDQIIDVYDKYKWKIIESITGINLSNSNSGCLVLQYLSNEDREMQFLILNLNGSMSESDMFETIRNELFSRKASNGFIQL